MFMYPLSIIAAFSFNVSFFPQEKKECPVKRKTTSKSKLKPIDAQKSVEGHEKGF